jgi:hypothetical protein
MLSQRAHRRRLVRQAEAEMRGDKKFLEDAYRNHEGWRPKAARGQVCSKFGAILVSSTAVLRACVSYALK